MRPLAVLAGLTVLALITVTEARAAEPRPRFVIDADTSNEVDDAYAIARAMLEPSIEVVGLSSAQWQASHWATPDTLEDSQRLNEVLLAHLGRERVPHPRGAHARLYDWGDDLAQHSAAAYFLIDQARRMPDGEKLNVIVLGASTNLASALIIAPEIRTRLRVYLLGTGYDASRAVWTKLDFNCMMAPRAIAVVLDTEGLELHVMPHNVALPLSFDAAVLRERFQGRSSLHDFLVARWEQHVDASRRTRILWDLALVEAILRPALAQERQVRTPPENTSRQVWVYTAIDADRMRADFFERLLAPARPE